MKHFYGLNEYQYRRQKKAAPVVGDTDELINGHIVIAGMSGTGKSHQAKRIIQSAARQGVNVEVFDVHEELDAPGSAAVKYSEATRYGFNPLTLNLNPHSGGVRKRINDFINTLNQTATKLGPKQESCLRNLMRDVYYLNGIYEDKPQSWAKREIDEATRAALLEQHNYGALKEYYPTIDDLIAYAQRKVKQMYLGADPQAVTMLEKVNRQAANIQRIKTRIKKGGHTEPELDKLEAQLAKGRDEAIKAYTDYVCEIESGRELTDVLKYNSREVLASVIERLENLNACGIFRSNAPPFGDARVRCHQIKSLSPDEQLLFTYTRLERIFREHVDGGVTDGVRRMLVMDEAHLFFADKEDNIVNKISREGRKFGLALCGISQQMEHFSEDFISNCGTVLLLGLHTRHWDGAIRKLRITEDELKYVKPQKVAAVKLQRIGDMGSKFQSVIVDEAVIREARSANSA